MIKPYMCTHTQCACACACACACVHACACAYGFMLCMHVHVHVRMHRVNCQLRYRMYGVCMPRLAPPSRLRCIGVRGTALRVDLRATTLRYGFTWLLKRFYFMFTPSRGCFSAEISVRVRPSRLKGRYSIGWGFRGCEPHEVLQQMLRRCVERAVADHERHARAARREGI